MTEEKNSHLHLSPSTGGDGGGRDGVGRRGAQYNTANKFLKTEATKEHIEAIDDWIEPDVKTQYIDVFPKTIVNKMTARM